MTGRVHRSGAASVTAPSAADAPPDRYGDGCVRRTGAATTVAPTGLRVPGHAAGRRSPGLPALLVVLALLTVVAVVGPAPGGTVGRVPVATVAPAAPPLAPAAPVRVGAPAIGLDSPVVARGLDAGGALDVPRDASVTAWYDGSPAPGTLGPAVLAAHVDWDRRPGPFARLRELAAGDLVEVGRADGTRATFEVQAVRRYPKDRFPTDEVYRDLPGAGLRLVTCGGSFDRGTRSYRDNLVAYAALVTPPPGPT